MNKNFKLLAISLSVFFVISCSVDKAYDFSKTIDTNVTFGGDSLSLPYSSTDTFSVGRILDLQGQNNVFLSNKPDSDFYYYHKESSQDIYQVYTTGDKKITSNVTNFLVVDVPDILRNENTSLDVADLKLELILDNPGDCSIEMTDCKLIGAKNVNGQRVLTEVKVPDFVLPANVSDKHVIFADLKDVLRNVPDTIYYSAIATESSLGQQIYGYKLGLRYIIDAPFAFGEKFQVVYCDSVMDFNKHVKDNSPQEVVLTGNVVNEVPLNVRLDFEAIDVDGNVMDDVTFSVVSDLRAASSNFNGATVSPLRVVVKGNRRGALSRFDGLRYWATGYSTSAQKGLMLMGHQRLKVEHVAVTIVGGIDVDL